MVIGNVRTYFGERHTSLQASQLTFRAKPKTRGLRDCLQHSIAARQRSGKGYETFCTTNAHELRVIPDSQIAEVWPNQVSSKSRSPGRTGGDQEPDGHFDGSRDILCGDGTKFKLGGHVCVSCRDSLCFAGLELQ